MKDENIPITDSVRASLSKFDGVWQRVTGTQNDNPLRDFIRDELCTASYNMALARRLTGHARAVLTAQAASARRRARRLRAELFIRSGEVYAPEERCAAPDAKPLPALRKAYERGTAAAAAYDKAAETADGDLAAMAEAFAAERRSEAQALRALIAAYF